MFYRFFYIFIVFVYIVIVIHWLCNFFQTGKLVRLSQQELMDCSWGEGNNACDGGEDFRAYQWVMKHGLTSEERYGQYLAAVSCKCPLLWII